MILKLHSLRRFFIPFLLTVSVMAAGTMLVPVSRAQETTFQIDQARTKIEFSLGSTLHTVHGTFTVKSAAIRFDPSSGKIGGTIVVDATSGESGNSGRDTRMHREILESAKFPDIIFTTTQITGVFAVEGASKLEVSGRLRLHGLDHDVTLPMEVKADGRNLEITTHFDIPYILWGLKNPSNFLLHVSDKVAIDIHARGRVQSRENP